ncbi:MAG: hypothetical protein IJH99_05700 [Eubacterium sp.]|nr:hypothetical protein [Eubacterium sp.]
MTDKEIYKRTLVFSVRALLFDILALILFIACPTVGFILGERIQEKGAIGLLIGLVIGIIALAVILRFVAYQYQAGQVAMMTRGITENELPDDIIAAAKQAVKERFVTIAIYFLAVNAIKGLFNRLGSVISNVGRSVGGNTGSAVGSVVSSVIQTIISYLCTCCLGWVFFRREQNAFKATCEGAVIFFKHGKTFAKNMGRIFGIGALSFVPIVGGLTALFYKVFSGYPVFFRELAQAFADSEDAAYLSDPKVLMVVIAFIIGVIIWGIIHSTFIRPYVLVGVLRNYINSGIRDVPTEGSFRNVLGVSAKFDKLEQKLG